MSNPRQLQQLVQDAMDSILVAHDRERVRQLFHRDFVQHNPWAEDGGAHVEAMCDFGFGVRMSCWAVQGDIVAYHGLYTAPNPLGDHPLVCVDLWRVQGGQIVEHWDALQPMPAEQAEALVEGPGDGFAERSPARVAANAAAARRLLELGVNRRELAVIRDLVDAQLRAHGLDEGVSDGRARYLDWVESAAPQVTVKRTVSSGELVFAQLLIESRGAERVVYDIFRFDSEGRVVELWRVAQDRVALAEAANPHPHF